MSSTIATAATQQRKLPRWQVKRGHSRVAASQLDHTLGELVDIGLGGFQIQRQQPLPTLDDTPLWVILDQSPREPHTAAITARPVWTSQRTAADDWRVGFRFQHLERQVEANLLLHLKSYPTNYIFIPATPAKVAALAPTPLTVIVFGFQPSEQRQLQTIIQQSALRPTTPDAIKPTYLLHSLEAVTAADLILLDADDLDAVDACTAYVMDKPSIPIIRLSNKPTSGRQHNYVARDVAAPMILHALDAAAVALARLRADD